VNERQSSAVDVVICTRNRRETLVRAIESALAQGHRPLRIRVYDDESEDGTSEYVHSRFPDVRLERETSRRGYITLRNKALRDSSAEYVCFLDDDAYYASSTTIEKCVGEMESWESAAVLAMPMVEEGISVDARVSEVPAPGEPLRSFRGCACMMRRRDVMAGGGFRDFLVHQGEERDLSIRLYARSMYVAMGGGGLVVHIPSPMRDVDRLRFYSYRNTFLFSLLNVPALYMVQSLVTGAAGLLGYRFRWSCVGSKMAMLVRGWRGAMRFWRERDPVSAACYRAWRRLPGHLVQYCGPNDALPPPARRGDA
jgi:glycosyltransferase involved in cell wall biosynthesis